MLNPQLPASAVVTPCNGDGVSAPSQNTWASKWVWTSMKPGVTSAGGVDRASGPASVHLADRDDAVALDAHIGPACRAPVPSTTVPPEITVSSIGGPSLTFVGQMIVMNRLRIFIVTGDTRPDAARG